MPNTVSDNLQASGISTALAYEIQQQASAGKGSISGLIAAGLPISTAVHLAPMFDAKKIDADLLATTGLNHEQARTIAKFAVSDADPDNDA